jgi:hypothetical protein
MRILATFVPFTPWLQVFPKIAFEVEQLQMEIIESSEMADSLGENSPI